MVAGADIVEVFRPKSSDYSMATHSTNMTPISLDRITCRPRARLYGQRILSLAMAIAEKR